LLFTSGYRFHPKISAGAYFLSSTDVDEFGTLGDAETKIQYFGLEGFYLFINQKWRIFYAGIRIGPSRIRVQAGSNGSIGNNRFSTFAYSGLTGYDHFLTREFAIGIELIFTNFSSATEASNPEISTIDSFNMFTIMTYGKLWLFE